MTFGEKLQKLRKSNNFSQEQLAEKLGVSRQAISKWEMGTLPDIENIVRISQYFDCSLDYLLNNENDETMIDELPDQKPQASDEVRKNDGKIYISSFVICIGGIIALLLPLFAELYQAFDMTTNHTCFTDSSYYILHSPLLGVVFISVLLIGFGIVSLYLLLKRK